MVVITGATRTAAHAADATSTTILAGKFLVFQLWLFWKTDGVDHGGGLTQSTGATRVATLSTLTHVVDVWPLETARPLSFMGK
jgi:hypothetical protein